MADDDDNAENHAIWHHVVVVVVVVTSCSCTLITVGGMMPLKQLVIATGCCMHLADWGAECLTAA